MTFGPTTAVIRVLVADDHSVVRRALRLLLETQDGVEVVGESANVPEVVEHSFVMHPDVVVCDLTMPGGSTLEAIREIVNCGAAVVVLTMQSDPSFAAAALRAGAMGYLLKESAPEALLTAVRAAAAGDSYVDPTIGGRLATLSAGRHGDRADKLSPREVEVLTLLALGHTNAETAAELHVSCRTVESHRAHIQQKTGAQTRADLVRHALDHGLLPGPQASAARS